MKHCSSSIQILESRWQSLLLSFQVEPELIQQVFRDLVAAYSSINRFYHTLQHIQHILDTLDDMKPMALNFPTVQLAAWFHDVIYNSKSQDNEEKSAEYAVAALTRLTIPSVTVERVKTLILSTKTHQATPDDIDCQILLDADLAILGAAEIEYKTYRRAIRQEYSWLTDKRYRVGRKEFLEQLLQRQNLYFTEQMFITLEVRARQNIQAELSTLSSESWIRSIGTSLQDYEPC
ncbi:MAG TPA: hypothetical protein DDZ80_10835 [Cyanobacteria bacterium UBA8803]|nr:hypothetical protein [Cyanobacteria bacterium UBA9273]HBL58987.1 hypothetical protein [Cyanobacteria bacterium UBA8803]